MILHIASRAEWALAQAEGLHKPGSLLTEGFVHCSDPGTVHLPAGRLFAGRTDLVLLELDPSRLGAPLRWEPGHGNPAGPWFPHVYGPIRVTAVRAAHDFPPEPDGTFRLPRSLAEFAGN